MQLLTEELIKDLLARQRQFFSRGATLSYDFRRASLLKLKAAILNHQTELEEALYKDLGKNRQESYTSEIGFVLAEITHTLKHLRRWMRPVRAKSTMSLFLSSSRAEKVPYGSVLIIGPFNYPFQLLVEPLVAAVAAGNCAVLCPSELTPNTSAVIKSLINAAFAPEYILCTDGGIENNSKLIASRFDKIFFTGSINVGKIVMRAAADNLAPVTLELGGKSPVIVTDKANLPVACERIAWGKFMNAGQTCVAPDYVFVKREIMGDFLSTLESTVKRMYGDDIFCNRDYGRIVNARHTERLAAILSKDGKYLAFGGEVKKEERFISPSVLCPPDTESAECMKDEIFGPILPVFAYDNLDEAISYINSKEKPLALYIFSEDKGECGYILKRTSSGGVSINDTVSHIINPNLPFGGIGYSGMGNYHGEYGFMNFTHLRAVLRRSTKFRSSLAHPPFSDKKLKTIKKYVK